MMKIEQAETYFQNTNVLITGGLGFIGANLAHRLVKLGANITIVDCLIPEQGGNRYNIKGIEDKITVIEGDLRNRQTLDKVCVDPDFVFNLAGQSSHWDSMLKPQVDLEINCIAHLNILNFLENNKTKAKIVLTSTRQIYGRPTYLPVNEEHPLNPVDINGIHRIANEQYHLLYSEHYGIRCVILRLTNTIGPRMRVKDARQTFLGLWIRLALEGIPFKVWGGGQMRDLNYVDDVINGLLMVAVTNQESGRIYNLGASPAISLLQLAVLITEFTGCRFTVEEFPEARKSIDIGDYYADFNRIHREIGWEPKITIRDAVERTVGYFREHLKCYI